MGKIKVDQIEIESGNSIQLNNPVKIKSYDAAGISALTPASGDLIYDSDNSKLKVYTGSAWEEVGATLDLSALGQSIIPDTDITYDLGSATYKFRDLYLSGSSINLGDHTITADSTSISLSGSFKLKQQTTAQIDALTGMSDGEMVYDTTTKRVKVYDSTGAEWTSIEVIGSGSGITASGGNTIQTYTIDGVNYKSHTFTSSGTFQVTAASSTSAVDVLLVAGGGAGGNDNAGGGGAGGLLAQTSVSVSAQNYSIVIGSGGARGNSTDGNGSAATSGNNTTGFNYTATGGGQGGSAGSANNAGNGGSGGGLQGTEISGSAGTGISGQGNNGGTSNNTGGGGGGGGAGAAGTAATSTVGATGGNGLNNAYQTGSDIAYAGGGAGGNENNVNTDVSGGTGGGGDSFGNDGTAGSGDINKGAGGAGGTHPGTLGGNGGSGIVIVRYTI
jgi:hypothetical protein